MIEHKSIKKLANNLLLVNISKKIYLDFLLGIKLKQTSQTHLDVITSKDLGTKEKKNAQTSSDVKNMEKPEETSWIGNYTELYKW